MIVKYKLVEGGRVPTRATEGSSGLDLYARLAEPAMFMPGQQHVIPVGIALEIKNASTYVSGLIARWEAQVRPRSGLARDGVHAVLGTIDADYRGEIAATLINLGPRMYVVRDGDRVAQLVFSLIAARPTFYAVEELTSTARGVGGYGSTGK